MNIWYGNCQLDICLARPQNNVCLHYFPPEYSLSPPSTAGFFFARTPRPSRQAHFKPSAHHLRIVIAASHCLPILASSAVHATDMRDWQTGVSTSGRHTNRIEISWPDLGFCPLPPAGIFFVSALPRSSTRIVKNVVFNLEAAALSTIMKVPRRLSLTSGKLKWSYPNESTCP